MKVLSIKFWILFLALSSSSAFAAMRIDSATFEVESALNQCNGCQSKQYGRGTAGLVTRYVLSGWIIIRQSDTEKYTSITTTIPAYAKVEAFGPALHHAPASLLSLPLVNIKGKPLKSIFGKYYGVDLSLSLIFGANIRPAINENQVVLGLVGMDLFSAGAIAQFRKFQLIPGYFAVGNSTDVSVGDIKIEKDGATESKTMDLKSILEIKI